MVPFDNANYYCLYRRCADSRQAQQPKTETPTHYANRRYDGRIYFRGAPPEEWKALEEEYQR